jgi:hypothetical protein
MKYGLEVFEIVRSLVKKEQTVLRTIPTKINNREFGS